MYDPTLGRFLQRDPSELPGFMDVYRYAADSPTNVADASGLQSSSSAPKSGIDWLKAKRTGKKRNEPGFGIVEEYTVQVGAESITVWKGDPKVGGGGYCHGLTFGGIEDKSGPFNPDPRDVPKILKALYTEIPCAQAKPGDIAIWMSSGEPAMEKGGCIAHSATFVQTQTKMANGKEELDVINTKVRQKYGAGEIMTVSFGTAAGGKPRCYRRK
jgi:hypothetical protein